MACACLVSGPGALVFMVLASVSAALCFCPSDPSDLTGHFRKGATAHRAWQLCSVFRRVPRL